jgi:hypothetical protein
MTNHGGGTTKVQFTRRQADDFLFDIAKQDNVWWWRRAAAYKGLRWFGALKWKKA